MDVVPTSCLHTSYSAAAFAVTQWVSWLVPLALAMASPVHIFRVLPGGKQVDRWGRQFVLVAFGFYIFFWSFALYIFQVALAIPRVDPFCPMLPPTYGVPSTAAFYVGCSATFLVALAICMRFWYSWINTLYLAAWWLIVPGVLIWVSFNTWQEVLLSVALGILVSTAFFIMVWRFLRHDMPFLLQQPLWSWFNCVDTWVQSQAQQDQAEELYVDLHAAQERYGKKGFGM